MNIFSLQFKSCEITIIWNNWAKNSTSQFCSQDGLLLSSTPPWNLLSHSSLPWLALLNLYRCMHRNKTASLWVIVFILRARTILHFFPQKSLHFTFNTSREVLGGKNIFNLNSSSSQFCLHLWVS